MRFVIVLIFLATVGRCLSVDNAQCAPAAANSITPVTPYRTSPVDNRQNDRTTDISRRRLVLDGVASAELVQTSPVLQWYSNDYRFQDDSTSFREADWERNKRLAFKTATRMTAIAGVYVGIWGLEDSCRDLANGEDTYKNSHFCIVGAIITTVQLIAHGNKIMDWAIFEVGAAKLTPWAGRVIASMGTFMSPRGLIHSRAEKVRRAEAVLSARIGLDIRHIGHWNPSDDEHLGRRQASDTVPVFAATADGQHIHFAMATDREANQVRIKTGLGPGAETAANVAGLLARGIPRPKFNAQHFDGGGLDVIGRSNIIGSQDEVDSQPSVDDPGSFSALFDAFACYLNLGDGTGQASSEDIPGLWWQIYDDESAGTLAAGAVAPFLDNNPSIISWLRPEGGLEVKDDCTAVLHDELRTVDS